MDQHEIELQNFVNKQNRCPLCSSVLVLYIRKCCTEDELEHVHEDAVCNSCEVKTRSKTYTLH